MRLDIYVHFDVPALLGIDASLQRIFQQLTHMEKAIMTSTSELAQAAADNKQAVADLGVAVDAIPPAVNALEAKITAALASVTISPADQANIDQAFNDLRAATAAAQTAKGTVDAAAADAADGVDEAAGTKPGP